MRTTMRLPVSRLWPEAHQANLVDGRAVEMVGMIVGRHVVTATVVVDKEDARPWRDGELFR